MVALGEIVATHGIDGWLKLNPYNPNSPALLSAREIFVEKDKLHFQKRLKAIKPHKNVLLLRLEEVDGIDEAKKWIGSVVSVDEASLPPLQSDEYYYYQVVGLDVFDTEGKRIGAIARITSTPGGDLYVVDGAKEYLIPVTKEIIAKIDFDAGRVVIDPPEGLLEL